MSKWKLALIEAIGVAVIWLIAIFIENTFGKPAAVHIATPPIVIYFIIKVIIYLKRGSE